MAVTRYWRCRRVTAGVALIFAALLTTGCGGYEDAVRDTCAEHGGVNTVSGSLGQYVTCRDGYYKVIG